MVIFYYHQQPEMILLKSDILKEDLKMKKYPFLTLTSNSLMIIHIRILEIHAFNLLIEADGFLNQIKCKVVCHLHICDIVYCVIA